MDVALMSILELEALAFRMVEQRDAAIDNLRIILSELDKKRRMPPPTTETSVSPAVPVDSPQ